MFWLLWVNLDFDVWADAVGAGSGEKWKGGERKGKWQLSSCIPLNTVASLEWFSELYRSHQPIVMVFCYKRNGEKKVGIYC